MKYNTFNLYVCYLLSKPNGVQLTRLYGIMEPVLYFLQQGPDASTASCRKEAALFLRARVFNVFPSRSAQPGGR